MPRILIPLSLGIVGIAVIVGLIALAPRTPGGTGGSVAVRQGFGKIPLLTADASAGDAVSALAAGVRTREVAAPQPAAADSTIRLVAPDVAVGSGVSGSAGIGFAEPGKPSMIYPTYPEQYLPPRVITTWEGDALPEIPGELAVFRTAARGFAEELGGMVRGLGLRVPGGLSLSGLTFRGGADGNTVYSFDGAGGMFGWYKERDWTGEEAARGRELSDADAIAAAGRALAELGIDLSRYGAPQVMRFDDPCGRGMPCIMEERAASGEAGMAVPDTVTAVAPSKDMAPSIWPGPWWPSLTVRYAALLDGRPTLEWDGADGGGITVQISSQDRSAESGNILLLSGLERSLYPTQSAEAIREAALRGGINPWGGWENGIYTPAEEARRPVVRIKLTEARLGYIQKESYFIPVVAFRGTVTDEFGNTYPHAVLVPALDPAAFAVEEPTPVPVPLGKPVPEPLMLPAQTDAEAAPTR